MNLSRLKPGDTVEVNVRGRKFEATFKGTSYIGALIEPPSNVSYFEVSSRQIVKRIAKGPRQTS